MPSMRGINQERLLTVQILLDGVLSKLRHSRLNEMDVPMGVTQEGDLEVVVLRTLEIEDVETSIQNLLSVKDLVVRLGEE